MALKKLLEEGYIKREPDPKDHRSYKVCLTPKAEQFKPEFKEILSLWTELLTEGFSDTEKSEASAYLKRMHDNAVKVLKRERG